MAQNIKLKRSSVPGKVPTVAQLDAGEIAINTADGRLFFERDDSTIQHIVTTNSDTTGSIHIIGAVTASGDLNVSGTVGIGTTSTALGKLQVAGNVYATSFTGSLFGTASVALSAPNIYNTDGILTGNRIIDADGNDFTIVADTGNTFTISSDPAGTVAIDGLTSGTRSHLVGIDTADGKLYTMTTSSIQNVVSASYSSTAGTTAGATGGNNFVGTGTTYLDYLDLGSSIAGGRSLTSASGSVIANGASNATIIQVNVNSFEAMFIDYILYDFDRNNKRAGNLRLNWNTSEIVFDETSTRDIGDTTGFVFSVDNDGTNAKLQATNTVGLDMYLVYEYKLLYIV